MTPGKAPTLLVWMADRTCQSNEPARAQRFHPSDTKQWCNYLSSLFACLVGTCRVWDSSMPIHSMYAIYAYIDPPNHPNVGIYGIHGASGIGSYLSDPPASRPDFSLHTTTGRIAERIACSLGPPLIASPEGSAPGTTPLCRQALIDLLGQRGKVCVCVFLPLLYKP